MCTEETRQARYKSLSIVDNTMGTLYKSVVVYCKNYVWYWIIIKVCHIHTSHGYTHTFYFHFFTSKVDKLYVNLYCYGYNITSNIFILELLKHLFSQKLTCVMVHANKCFILKCVIGLKIFCTYFRLKTKKMNFRIQF